ncbi:uncharacterized protein EV420DRAFT_1635340 [Desarmillaria tabescens]|uniref:DUF6534 domain-containing protein n=1 Tax=Armillaria tabescens TaxID=1929756 RepID=A0AA39NM77_ARMTA|nr:uncharacterized protein EV420DRAFT_1635340 [Desarmillaria tabescens]KAK0468079.1 hypothetical protein EV420DRAFT_1635340 [Desarmillaria tabescens]
MSLFDTTLGAIFIGLIAGSIVYGISLLQLYTYCLRFGSKDGWFLQAFIAVLMSVDTFHLILICHALYYYTVSHFGDFDALAVSTWSIATHIPVGAIASSLVQFFYAYRVYALGRSLVLPSIIIFFSVAQTVIGIVLALKIASVKFFANARESMPYGVSALSCEVVCDIIITLSMVYYLRKSETGIPSSSKVLRKLTHYMVNTGALTTAMAIATVIGWAVTPDELIDITFYVVMVRLYPCSFLAILNSRSHLRNVMRPGTAETVHLSQLTSVHRDSSRPTTDLSSSNSSEGVKYGGPFATLSV